MSKVGIITYHAAYNYGSVLQAFATQEAIAKNDMESEIINYRFEEQRNIYAMYRIHCGFKKFAKDVLLLPIHFKRINRKNKFEKFIRERLKISKELAEPEEALEHLEKYDILISGSDQIWNKHSLELENVDWKYMYPYLFHGAKKKKISYASSIANMKDSELDSIKEDVKQFQFLSVRESSDIQKMEALSEKNVTWVVDPTFLLTKDEWIKRLNLKEVNTEPYILFYSLSVGYSELDGILKKLKRYANNRKLKVKIINPYIYVKNDELIELVADCGPQEFLEYIYNATLIITDSYHGTALSINLEKEFFSICGEGKSENRKRDLLAAVGLQERSIARMDLIKENYDRIDYEKVRNKLEIRRQDSFNYLQHALG